ncbi:unnamed protein product [Closterium sp. NIES-54]
MASQRLVLGFPRVFLSLPPSPAPPCTLCVAGRLRATPHSPSLRPATAPFQTLQLDVWVPAPTQGPARERYFLVVVNDFSRYTTVFPLAKKTEVTSTLIRWLLATEGTHGRRVSSLESDCGGEFCSGILAGFCGEQGIVQSWTLPESPQQNGVAERRIGLVMDMARTSMIHAHAPHFLWPYAVRYAAHQLKLQPRVLRPEASTTSLWTGSPGAGSAFRVWGCLALVCNTSADKLSARTVPCVFLGFPVASVDWSFYHPPLHQFLDSCDVRFDGCGVGAGGTRSGGAHSRGVGAGGAGTGGASSGGAGVGGPGTGGAWTGGAGAGDPDPVEHSASPPPRHALPSGLPACARGAGAVGAGAAGVAAVGPAGAAAGALAAAAAAAAAAPSGAVVFPACEWPPGPWTCQRSTERRSRVRIPVCALRASQCGGCQRSTGDPRLILGKGYRHVGLGGYGRIDPLLNKRFYPNGLVVGILIGLPSSPPVRPPSPPAFCPTFSPPDARPTVWSSPPPRSPPVVRHYHSRPCPSSARPSSPVTDLHTTLLCTSLRRSPPLVLVLPSPPSSLPVSPTPISDYYHVVRPIVSHVLATGVIDPRFSPSSISALTAAVADFAAASRLDYTSRVVPAPPTRPLSVGGEFALGYDVLEDRHSELEYLTAASPTLCAMLLSPEGDPDALDIPTHRTYREAV